MFDTILLNLLNPNNPDSNKKRLRRIYFKKGKSFKGLKPNRIGYSGSLSSRNCCKESRN